MTVKRQILIQPYLPDFTENLGDNTGQYSDSDIGKAVKYSGDTMVACAENDEIVGFVQSVEPGTKDGHSIGSVRKNGRVHALDEAGTLAVGNVVVAGTAGTLGTSAYQNVKVADPAGVYSSIPGEVVYKWVVIGLAATPGAGALVLLERV